MTSDQSDSTANPELLDTDNLPERVGDRATVLVATAGDPSRYGTGLGIIAERGGGSDTALIVTTSASAAETITRYDQLSTEGNRPAIGVVDTVSEGQSVSALYSEVPVVFTPAPGDLERLVVALSDLAMRLPAGEQSRHLVVGSVTPLLNAASTTQVETVLERIVDLRTGDGLCLLGIDYTAHEESTMETIAGQADGVLWVTRPTPERLAFEYEPAGGHYSLSGSKTPSDG